jgi:hypothetical protein
MGLLSKAAKIAIAARKRKAKEKAKKLTQKLPKDNQLDEGQAPSRGTLDVEAGKAGKTTSGTKSMPSTKDQETGNIGRVKRNKKVAQLETKVEKGDATKEERAELRKLNRMSAVQDMGRSRRAAATASTKAREGKGISLAGEMGTIKVGAKTKLKDSDMMVGNTTNGITKDGEIIGNPTDNQVATTIRNLDARQKLSADAKRNLAKLKRMSKSDRQDAALRKMERKMKDTGPDKTNRKFNKGSLVQPKASQTGLKKLPTTVRNKMGYMNRGGAVKSGSTDMRKGGMFY